MLSLFVWPWLVVNDRKFLVRAIFFFYINQSAVFFFEPATKRNQPTEQAVERFVRFASFVWRIYASPSPQGDAACDLGILCEYQLVAYFLRILLASPESDPPKLNWDRWPWAENIILTFYFCSLFVFCFLFHSIVLYEDLGYYGWQNLFCCTTSVVFFSERTLFFSHNN